MNIKILIATHKKYRMPEDFCYLPIHVGKEGKSDIGYIGDNIGDNISKKNPYYCELTGLYWAWKNLECDYTGLVHYRRHFTNKNFIYRLFNNKFSSVLTSKEIIKLLNKYDIIIPKRRNYYIETLYSHYEHTHYVEHLDKTRLIIFKYYKEYIDDFDKVMQQKGGYMFNMFITKKEILNEYCDWLFSILNKLEEEVDISQYDAFQARLYGRVSELLFNVWLKHSKLTYKEISYIHMEKINWLDKISSFLKAKFLKVRFKNSF